MDETNIKLGIVFYDKRKQIFGEFMFELGESNIFYDTNYVVHYSTDCVEVNPDTPQNRLALQLKYSHE